MSMHWPAPATATANALGHFLHPAIISNSFILKSSIITGILYPFFGRHLTATFSLTIHSYGRWHQHHFEILVVLYPLQALAPDV